MQQQKNEIVIPAQDISRLLSAHDGNMALLYLFRLSTGSRDREEAAAALNLTGAEVDIAAEKLQRLSLIPSSAPSASTRTEVRPSDDDLPSYTAEDLDRRFLPNEEFQQIVREATRVVGKVLSANELNVLCGIYDHLGLPADVLHLLLNHCAELCEKKYGPSRRPTARTIKTVAYQWANRGLMTYELADEYLKSCTVREHDLAELLPVLRLQGRPLSDTALKYLNSWLDMGFREDALAIAYDRTVTNTGELKWSYMNKILLSWAEKKLFTAEAIAAGDTRSRRREPGPRSDRSTVNADYLTGLIDKL